MAPALRLVAAWMLGVVATLCVVGLAARRGQLWFHEPRAACPAVVSDVSVPAVPAASADAPFDAIVKYLGTRFGEPEHGIAYKGAPIVTVDSSRLRRLFPDMRFFTTKLHRGALERRDVELLVLIRRYAGQDVILSCTAATCDSPIYGAFLSQFMGVRASTIESRREVALAMAELLANLVPAGKTHSSTEWFKGTGAEIWQGRRHWRDVDVSTESGVVNRIAIGNPSEHRIDAFVSP